MAPIVRNGVGARVSPTAKTVALATATEPVTRRPRNSSARSPATGRRNLGVSVHLLQREKLLNVGIAHWPSISAWIASRVVYQVSEELGIQFSE